MFVVPSCCISWHFAQPKHRKSKWAEALFALGVILAPNANFEMMTVQLSKISDAFVSRQILARAPKLKNVRNWAQSCHDKVFAANVGNWAAN
jgi:hypothetical protein